MDYADVFRIGDEQLGENYMQGLLNPMDDNQIWLAIDQQSEQVVGFAYVIVKKKQATIKSIAIRSSFQNKGFGTKLINTALSELQATVETFEVVTWERSDSQKIPIEKLLLNLGFKRSKTEVNYWFEDSLGSGYDCPSCGNPCRCNAVFFSSPSSCFAMNSGL